MHCCAQQRVAWRIGARLPPVAAGLAARVVLALLLCCTGSSRADQAPRRRARGAHSNGAEADYCKCHVLTTANATQLQEGVYAAPQRLGARGDGMAEGWRGQEGVWGDMARPQMAQEQEFIARARQAPSSWALNDIHKWDYPRGGRGRAEGRGGRDLTALVHHNAHGHQHHHQALAHQPFRCLTHTYTHSHTRTCTHTHTHTHTHTPLILDAHASFSWRTPGGREAVHKF